jgi:hypothetical protein
LEENSTGLNWERKEEEISVNESQEEAIKDN